MPVRVRFAPSPTGYLHIGGARTALFNWLWARKSGGTFILRVEDTDRERSTPESVEAILDSMRWLGLDWNEGPEVGGSHGPYFQSERLAIYREHAERLIASGHAYRCFCTKDELAAARAAFEKSGQKGAFRYPGTCRSRTDEPDRPFVVRFKSPETGTTGWDDLVKGRIDYPNSEQQDFILLRPDGMPLYNFGAFVDDLTMSITLVARGDDHLVNTPPQILLYRALGAGVPAFAHLPMILAPNNEKLSKRHAAVSVLEYRDMGYVPDGVVNYLARLGWSHGDQEIFTREELIAKFDWVTVGKSPAKYDAKKFAHVEAEHLRMLPDSEVARLAAPFVAAKTGAAVAAGDPRLLAGIPQAKPRATTLKDIADAIDFYFYDEPPWDEQSKKKFLVPASAPVLRELASTAGAVEPFTAAALEARVKAWLEERKLELKDVAQAARVAMTGRSRSPGLFEVMEVLGRSTVLARLERGAAIAEKG